MPKKSRAQDRRVISMRDPLTGKARKTILFTALAGMMVEARDKLPGPIEFRGYVGRGKKKTLARLRKRWVGIGFCDEGEADGTEPLLCVDDTVMSEEEFEVAKIHAA